jgi:hypothetical protein
VDTVLCGLQVEPAPDGNRKAKTDWQAGVTSNYGGVYPERSRRDAIYELTSVLQGANTTESYTGVYPEWGRGNPVGNRLSSLGVSPYSYNASNELTSTPNATYGYDLNGNAVTKNDSTGITTYDSNGNVTNDSNHTYTWDADGNSLSVDTVSLTFDAFDRMVEQNRSGSYTQIVYTPSGAKLALGFQGLYLQTLR